MSIGIPPAGDKGTDDRLRDEIVARLSLEREVREQINADPKRKSFSLWDTLNSGFVLLLVTTIVTSILVPIYQKRQQDADWWRQLRSENAKYHLGMMRQCLQDFAQTGTYPSVAYEQLRPALHMDRLSEPDYKQLRKSIAQLQEERFKQSAKVTSLLVNYPDPSTARRLAQQYIAEASIYCRQIEAFLDTVHNLSVSGPIKQRRGGGINLDALVSQLDEPTQLYKTYDATVAELLRQIDREEKRYEQTP